MLQFLQNFLTSRNLEKPDGRELWEYQPTDNEIQELEELLQKHIQKEFSISESSPRVFRFWQGYVLFLSYRLARDWEAGPASYRLMDQRIHLPAISNQTAWVKKGLEQWKLRILKTQNTEQPLYTAIYSGGLPPVVFAQEYTGVSGFIRSGLNECLRHEDLEPAFVLEQTRLQRSCRLNQTLTDPNVIQTLHSLVLKLLDSIALIKDTDDEKSALKKLAEQIDLKSLPIHQIHHFASFLRKFLEDNQDLILGRQLRFHLTPRLSKEGEGYSISFRLRFPRHVAEEQLQILNGDPFKPMIVKLLSANGERFSIGRLTFSDNRCYELQSRDTHEIPSNLPLDPNRLELWQDSAKIGYVQDFLQPDWTKPLFFDPQGTYLGQNLQRFTALAVTVISRLPLEHENAVQTDISGTRIWFLKSGELPRLEFGYQGKLLSLTLGCSQSFKMEIIPQPNGIRSDLKPPVYTKFPRIQDDSDSHTIIQIRHEQEAEFSETFPLYPESGLYQVVATKKDSGEILASDRFLYWPDARDISCCEGPQYELKLNSTMLKGLEIQNALHSDIGKASRSFTHSWRFRPDSSVQDFLKLSVELQNGSQFEVQVPIQRYAGSLHDQALQSRLEDGSYIARSALQFCTFEWDETVSSTMTLECQDEKVPTPIRELLSARFSHPKVTGTTSYIREKISFPLDSLFYGERTHQRLGFSVNETEKQYFLVETDANLDFDYKQKTLQIKDSCWQHSPQNSRKNFLAYALPLHKKAPPVSLPNFDEHGLLSIESLWDSGGIWVFWVEVQGIVRAACQKALHVHEGCMPWLSSKSATESWLRSLCEEEETTEKLQLLQQGMEALRRVPASAIPWIESALEDPEFMAWALVQDSLQWSSKVELLEEKTPWHRSLIPLSAWKAGIRMNISQRAMRFKLPSNTPNQSMLHLFLDKIPDQLSEIGALQFLEPEFWHNISPEGFKNYKAQKFNPDWNQILSILNTPSTERGLSEFLSSLVEEMYEVIQSQMPEGLDLASVNEETLKVIASAYMAAEITLKRRSPDAIQIGHIKVLHWFYPKAFQTFYTHFFLSLDPL